MVFLRTLSERPPERTGKDISKVVGADKLTLGLFFVNIISKFCTISNKRYLCNYVILSVAEGNSPNEMGEMSLTFKRQKGCVARVSNPWKGTFRLILFVVTI